MAEVHIFGQLFSAENFPDNSLSCRYLLLIGGGWRLLRGVPDGQTHTDLPEMVVEGRDKEAPAFFCHPLDFHFSTITMQNWPRLAVEVLHYDAYGRQEPYGYGTVHLPISPGEHSVRCHCWRPKGASIREELMQKFLGGGLRLRSLQQLDDPVWRSQLETVAMGCVNLRLSIITRHFDRLGIVC